MGEGIPMSRTINLIRHVGCKEPINIGLLGLPQIAGSPTRAFTEEGLRYSPFFNGADINYEILAK
mgnify:CR=1 FL=1